MYSRVIILAVTVIFQNFGLTWGEKTTASLVTQNKCGNAILEANGYTTDTFKPTVEFNEDYISISPQNPVIPGCFNLTARKVRIHGELTTLTAEFEMRFGAVPDPNEKPLACKKRNSECGCGIKNSCMYCDFCKNLKLHLPGIRANEKDVKINLLSDTKNPCACSIGNKNAVTEYDLVAEVCTPSGQELDDVLPKKVTKQVAADTGFTLFTTISMYNERFQSLNKFIPFSDNQIKDMKQRSLIGCHLIGTNVGIAK